MKKKGFLVFSSALVLMPILAVVILFATDSFRVRVLPNLGQIPSFKLVERTGKPYGSDDLKGKVWVASFIFTHCAGQCPLVCQKVQSVMKRLRFKANMRICLHHGGSGERHAPSASRIRRPVRGRSLQVAFSHRQ